MLNQLLSFSFAIFFHSVFTFPFNFALRMGALRFQAGRHNQSINHLFARIKTKIQQAGHKG